MTHSSATPTLHHAAEPSPIESVRWREMATVAGRVRAMRVQPWEGIATVEMLLQDDTAGLIVVFTGRRSIPGIGLGSHMEVTGRISSRRGYFAMLNPAYRLLHERH